MIGFVFLLTSSLGYSAFPGEGFILGNFRHPTRTDLTIDGLDSLIRNEGIVSLDETLSRLPEEMLQSYVLVYSSRSRQEASPQFPRVITYSNDARLIIAFNGHPEHRGYSKLEMIEFIPATQRTAARFDFAELEFNPSGPPVMHKNPAMCMNCHTIQQRPNWDGYLLWPGVYGSEDDHLTNKFAGRDPEVYSQSTEYKAFKSYLRTRVDQISQKKGRYRFLRDRDENPDGVLIPKLNAAAVPNLRFNILLHDLAFQRALSQLQLSNRIEQVKHALQASACENFLDFFSDDARPRIAARLKEDQRELESAHKAEITQRYDRAIELNGSTVNPRSIEMLNETFDPTIARLKIIMELYLDTSLKDLSVAPFGRMGGFGTGDSGINLFLMVYVPRLFTSPTDLEFITNLFKLRTKERCVPLLNRQLTLQGPLN